MASFTVLRGQSALVVALRLLRPAVRDDELDVQEGAGAMGGGRFGAAEIALQEIDRLRASGLAFGSVLAATAYGRCTRFRRGLRERGLAWMVGVPRNHAVFPVAPQNGRSGCHAGGPLSAEAALAEAAWINLDGRLVGGREAGDSTFSALRVRAGGGSRRGGRGSSGEVAWLVGERGASGLLRCHLCNLPEAMDLTELAAIIAARSASKPARMQVKRGLRLKSAAPRDCAALRDRALLNMIGCAYLRHVGLERFAS